MAILRGVLVCWWVLALPAAALAGGMSLGDPDRMPAPKGAVGYPSRAADLDALPGFRTPPPGYGEVPYWWWTGDPLDKDRLVWQMEELHRKGISGMQVNYAHEDTPGWPTYAVEPEIFTEEWWAMWKFVAAECAKRGMGIGLSGYTLDWPNGKSLVSRTVYGEAEIQGRDLAIAQKVRAEAGKAVTMQVSPDMVSVRAYPLDKGRIVPGSVDLTQAVRRGRLGWTPPKGAWEVWVYTARRKPGTLNPIHPLAGRRVIEKFFQPFQDHAPGKSAAGLNYFFQDELQFGVGDRIWCDDLPEQFRRRKGYDLFEALPAMYQDVGPKTPKYRLDYMDVKMQLVQERYFIPIFQWHWSRGKIYGCDPGSRGRNPMEFGDYFSSVRWYTAPGHDTPGGHADLIKGKVSSSIAQLYKRPRVWLEGYHSLGWGATPENLMFATRENYLYGCTLLNLHGLYYTTHGGFWEWAPPSYHFRMPYWEHMGMFLKYFERLSYLMSQGTQQCDVAVMYPVSPGQANLGGKEAVGTAFGAGAKLFGSGYDFVFMDHESLARAEARGGRLCVSGASYRVLVLPAMRAVRWSTLAKAGAFFRAGGVVIALAALPEASDRAGGEDPVLDAAVKDLFGATAAEAKAGARPEARTNDAGGTGLALLGAAPAKVRRYPGGFAGRWAWSKEPVQNVYLKAVWRGASPGPEACRIRFLCDNAGALYVNGKRLCEGADYTRGWTGEAALKSGDVITIDAHDADPPGRRRSAGLFLAIVRDGKTVLSTEDLRYTLARPGEKTWRTDPSTAGLAGLDPTNVHEAHLGVSGGDAVARLVGKVAERVPREVESDRGVRAVHRKVGPRDVFMVLGAPRGSTCTFGATGRAELWDPWTGQARPVHVVSQKAGRTTVRMPLEEYEAQMVVFTPGPAPPAVPETTLAEVTKVEAVGGRVIVTGYAASPGPQTATVAVGGRTVALRGVASPAPAAMPLAGEWEFELKPTLDNRWGDFRLPVTGEKLLGAEARIFRYAEENGPDPGWGAREFDDSRWRRVTCGFGQKFWKLGPLPDGPDPAALDAKLAALKGVDPAVAVEVGGRRYEWRPYAFSWRWGVQGDPGHQGYHGLKENISDDFLRLGRPAGGLNETRYGKEAAGSRYYLWTAVVAPQALRARVHSGGEIKPAAVYLNGSAVAAGTGEVGLKAGPNPLLLRYDSPGRGHFVLEASAAAAPSQRTPLSMAWYDRPGVLPLDALARVARPACWYRFVAPPGLRGLRVAAPGTVRAWADGRPLTLTAGPTLARGAVRYRAKLAGPVPGKAVVALRIEPPRGCYGGEAIAEPIALDCGPGTTALGDWSLGSVLECYSGGAWYRKTVRLSPEQVKGRAVLHLGQVAATAEVRVNGHQAGIRVAPPWKVDVTGLLHAGENRVEVLVYNTLANHYRTIPTRYRGQGTSGLLGPVSLEFRQEVTLRE